MTAKLELTAMGLQRDCKTMHGRGSGEVCRVPPGMDEPVEGEKDGERRGAGSR